MDTALLKSKITSAKQDLGIAEKELEKALDELKTIGLRPDKTIVTEVIERAFLKLRHARTQLAELEETIG